METLKKGLLQVEALADAQRAEVQELADICNRYENLHMHFGQHTSHSQSDRSMPHFLCYEDGKLVGYLVLDSFGFQEKELLGMVHPDYRRKGIFTKLLGAAKEVCRARGVQTLVFVVEKDALAGQALVKSVGAKYDFSEHEMVLETLREKNTFDDRLNFRRADTDDLDTLIGIMAESFGDAEEMVRPWVSRLMQDPHCHFYIATFGEAGLGCKEPVGCLRLDEADDSIGIYGFGVRPEYRGRGYGRQMLEEVVRDIRIHFHSQKQITLEVDVDNEVAKSLYRSAGFVERATVGYYNLDVVSGA